MVFIETPTFTKAVTTLVSDDDYSSLQTELAMHPDAGDLIPGGGGIRKIRFALKGRGKRGGARLIYYWQKSMDRIYLLVAFEKGKQTDLSSEQAVVLKLYVKELEKHG